MNKYLNIFITFICLLGLTYILAHISSAGTVIDFSDEMTRHQVNTYANHLLTFTLSSDWSAAETLVITFADSFNLLELEINGYKNINLSADSTDLLIDAVAGTDAHSAIGVNIEGQSITLTQNNTDTITAGTVIAIKIGTNTAEGVNQILNPVIADNYLISLSGTFGDTGFVLMPIIDKDTVPFEGIILPELSFNIVTADQTKTVNICNIGIFDSLSVGECSYRLAASTNAGQGFKIYIETTGPYENLELGTDFPYITEDRVNPDSTIQAGEDAYGLAIDELGTSLIAQGDFTDNDSPIPQTQTLMISSDGPYIYNPGNLSTSTKVTHRISINPNTTLPEGAYYQQIIYSIIANY